VEIVDGKNKAGPLYSWDFDSSMIDRYLQNCYVCIITNFDKSYERKEPGSLRGKRVCLIWVPVAHTCNPSYSGG
jgi:hypothetical protein